MITTFLSQFQIQRLGWTLLHFLWQGTVIVIVYAMLRRALARLLSAQGRYLLACAALGAMSIAPPLTFLLNPNAGGSAVWSISASEGQRLLPAVVAVWLLGVLVFSIRLAGGWRFTLRLRSTAHPAPPEWQQSLERIAERICLRPVRLLVSSMVDVPTVIGWLRPVILVPIECLTGLPFEHITALLAHEMAHIRRHDYLASILQSIAEAVLFYHPAVWWISEQIRVERELCCDDLAVAASGDVLAYARALAELESRQPSRLHPALAANGGSLVNRIRRLIEPANAVADSLPGPGAAWAMVLLWLAGVGVAAVHAAQTPAPPPARVAAQAPVSPASPLPSPLPLLAAKAKNTLLYDPIFSAQLAQPQAQPQDGDQFGSPWREWLNRDVVYIITDEERKAFKALNTDEEREQFVEQFWLRRDPTPDTIENEYKEELYRRIAYANEHYGATVPGWKTHRGRIYITFGPPDEIDSHPSAQPVPFEDWRYRFIEGIGIDVMIEFVDTARTGDYHMTMDPWENAVANGRAENLRKFERLDRFSQLRQPADDAKFRDLDDAIGKLTTYTTLPMQVRIDYLPVTASSVMTNITVQFENKDLQFHLQDGVQKAVVNLLGRISTMTRSPVATFEKPLEVDAPPDMLQKYAQQRQIFQQSVPLASGRYRLNLVAKDTVSGSMNNYEVALDVPVFDEKKLASSSLILADLIEKLPAKTIGGAMFVIGDTKVRPRLRTTFTHNEKLGIYLQVYNFGPDATTQKPSGSIEYEIDKAGSNEKIMAFSEDVASIPNASASEVTIKKLVQLSTLSPGTYMLKVTATDKNTNQSVQQQANFTVTAE